MVSKIIGLYHDFQETDSTDSDRLIIEISQLQLTCLVKDVNRKQIKAFEVFNLTAENTDWNNRFYEVRNASRILNRTYFDTHCYYHFEEVVIIPGQKFSLTAAADYLALVFGESNQFEVKYDTLLPEGQMVTAFRIRKSIHELIGRHFSLYKAHHVFSGIIEGLWQRVQVDECFLKLQFYKNRFIAACFTQGKLQLIQTFPFEKDEDVYYNLSAIIQHTGIDTEKMILELSGSIEEASSLYQQLKEQFTHIQFDRLTTDDSFANELSGYPAHYFTPFFNQAV